MVFSYSHVISDNMVEEAGEKYRPDLYTPHWPYYIFDFVYWLV